MPLAPPVIKIVLLVSFIIKYPQNYVTTYKVARKFSTARREHNVFRMHGRASGRRAPSSRERDTQHDREDCSRPPRIT
jgi:hypothetical protein